VRRPVKATLWDFVSRTRENTICLPASTCDLAINIIQRSSAACIVGCTGLSIGQNTEADYAFPAVIYRLHSQKVTVQNSIADYSRYRSSATNEIDQYQFDSDRKSIHLASTNGRNRGICLAISPKTLVCLSAALGCPTLKVPTSDGSSGVGAWVMQQDTGTAVVKCNKTDETWFLRCDGRQWKGHFGNCTTTTPGITQDQCDIGIY
jgi:hypothetical protein